jgi:hypothetical protein
MPFARTILTSALYVAGGISECRGQSKSARLQPLVEKLAVLETCLPIGDQALAGLRLGLTVGWRNTPWGRGGSVRITPIPKIPDADLPDPPSTEYLASLDRDIQLCALANGTTDTEQKSRIRDAVEANIQMKDQDCERFGMGRLVPVSVVTVKGGRQDQGWEILYTWIPVGKITTAERSSPSLSSPAILNLAPGDTFEIRARKTGTPGIIITSEKRTVTITPEQVVQCEIEVP